MEEIMLTTFNQLCEMKASKSTFLLNDLGVVRIQGEKTTEFLQGQLTCDVNQVSDQKGTLGALCNHQGRVLAIFYLYKQQADYICLLPKTIVNSFIEHLQKFAIFSKVTLEEVTEYNVYGYIGEHVPLNLAKALTFPDQSYGIFQDAEMTICNLPGIVPRYLILSRKELTKDCLDQDNALTWKLINIFSGVATVYPSTLNTVTPHMLNLHQLSAVSFQKGCYVGQEIIARTHYLGKSKRHLCLAEIAEPFHLVPGECVEVNNQEAGLVIESATSGTKTFLLAVLQDPLDRVFAIKNHHLKIIDKFE